MRQQRTDISVHVQAPSLICNPTWTIAMEEGWRQYRRQQHTIPHRLVGTTAISFWERVNFKKIRDKVRNTIGAE
jgi:hypothetical protein